jgi:hypothetical protein
MSLRGCRRCCGGTNVLGYQEGLTANRDLVKPFETSRVFNQGDCLNRRPPAETNWRKMVRIFARMNHSLEHAFLTNHGRRCKRERTSHEPNPRIFLTCRQHRSAGDVTSKSSVTGSRPAGTWFVALRADATAFHTNYERCSAAYWGFPRRGNSPELRLSVPATGVPITWAAIGAADHGRQSSQASTAGSAGSNADVAASARRDPSRAMIEGRRRSAA